MASRIRKKKGVHTGPKEGDLCIGREMRKATGEEALVHELISRSVNAAVRQDHEDSAESFAWIFSEDSDVTIPSRFTFEQCCHFVHVDPDCLRDYVLRARRGEAEVSNARLQRFDSPKGVAA